MIASKQAPVTPRTMGGRPNRTSTYKTPPVTGVTSAKKSSAKKTPTNTNTPKRKGHHIDVAFCVSGQDIWTASEDGKSIDVYSATTGIGKFYLEGHQASVTALCAGQNVTFSGSVDSTVRIWDAKAYHQMHVDALGHKVGCATALATSTCAGKMLWSGSSHGLLQVFDYEKMEILHSFHSGEKTIRCIDYHEDLSLVVAGGMDRKARVWAGTELLHTVEDVQQINCVHVDQGGRLWTGAKEVRVYDPRMNFRLLRIIQPHSNAVTSLSGWGATVVSGGFDGKVQAYDRSTFALQGILTQQENAINRLLTVDDSLWVSCAEQRVVQLDWTSLAVSQEMRLSKVTDLSAHAVSTDQDYHPTPIPIPIPSPAASELPVVEDTVTIPTAAEGEASPETALFMKEEERILLEEKEEEKEGKSSPAKPPSTPRDAPQPDLSQKAETLAGLESEKRRLEATKQELTDKVVVLQAMVDDIMGNQADLARSLASKEEQTDSLMEANRQLTDRLKMVESENSQLSMDNSDQAAQLNAVEKEKKKYAKDNQDLAAKLMNMEEDQRKRSREKEENENENEKEKVMASEAKKEKERIAADNSALLARQTELQAEKDMLANQVKLLEEDMQKQGRESESRIMALEAEREQLKTEISASLAHLNQLQAEKDVLTNQVKSLKEDQDTLAQESVELEQQCKELKVEREDSRKEQVMVVTGMMERTTQRSSLSRWDSIEAISDIDEYENTIEGHHSLDASMDVSSTVFNNTDSTFLTYLLYVLIALVVVTVAMLIRNSFRGIQTINYYW
jgi:WD40 repeat protein